MIFFLLFNYKASWLEELSNSISELQEVMLKVDVVFSPKIRKYNKDIFH